MNVSGTAVVSFLLLLCTIVSCDDQPVKSATKDTVSEYSDTEKNTPVDSPVTANPNTLRNQKTVYDSLQDDEIGGCGCSYAVSNEALQKGIYFLVASADSVAYWTESGRRERMLRFKTITPSESFTGDSVCDDYAGSGDTLRLRLKYDKRSGDESWRYHGKAFIREKNKPERIISISGDCGC